MAKAGRKPKQIDEAMAADMAYRGANNAMIADRLGIEEATLLRHCAKLLRQRRIDRKLEILDCQTAMLKAGNSTMAVWLGRNELDQSEERKITVEIPPNSIILEVVPCRRNANSEPDSTDAD